MAAFLASSGSQLLPATSIREATGLFLNGVFFSVFLFPGTKMGGGCTCSA